MYYSSGFWHHHGKDRPGKEIPVGKRFRWAGREWYIPAVYSCAKGLVTDCCMKVEAEEIRAFMDRWNLSMENDNSAQFTCEQQKAMNRDNPMTLHYKIRLAANGKALQADHGCRLTYNPCLPQEEQRDAVGVLKHYRLDPACGWVISRDAFRWATKKKPTLCALAMTMVHRPGYVGGPHFSVNAPGDTVAFTNPVTGTSHILTVREYEAGQESFDASNPLPPEFSDMEFPSHFHVMRYTLEPDVPDNTLRVSDYVASDRPREKAGHKRDGSATMGVIFGVPRDRETGESNKMYIALSFLRFDPVDCVEWKLSFREQKKDEMTVKLI